jgi:hypothetical protein
MSASPDEIVRSEEIAVRTGAWLVLSARIERPTLAFASESLRFECFDPRLAILGEHSWSSVVAQLFLYFAFSFFDVIELTD